MDLESSYGKVKTGGLKLKGEKKKKKKKSKKREHSGEREQAESGQDDAKRRRKEAKADCEQHGGWWACEKYHEVSGPLAIQFPTGCYMKAMDNGKFVLGPPHGDGEPPAPEEILMALKCGEGKISLKSGYDKYLRLSKSGHLAGVSDAVGALEQFQPVWQDGRTALLAPNGKFLSVDEDDLIIADKHAVGDMEVVRIRSNKEKEDINKKTIPEEERGTVGDVELKFTKKFMKFQDHKYRMRIDHASQGQILQAKEQGNLHETLLDRREKIKSDRMCK